MKYIKRFIFEIIRILFIPLTLLIWVIVWILSALLIITTIVWRPFVGNDKPLEWIMEYFELPFEIVTRLEDFLCGD